MNATQQIAEFGAVPVIVLDSPEQGAPLGAALKAGGLPVAEVTFRSPAAAAGIAAMTKEHPDLIAGAGTVLTLDQVKQAVDSGAQFIVTPGMNTTVVEHCLKIDMPVYPGVSGTEGIEMAMGMGLRVLKFFPAAAAGGVPMLRALSGPYQTLQFMPTGGISLANLHDYLALPQVIACGGSWIVPKKTLAAGDYAAIADLARATMESIVGFSLGDSALEIPIRYPERVRAYLARRGEKGSAGVTLDGNRTIVPYGSA